MNWLLRLYPREWRRRYGAEVEELLASQPRSLQAVVDLLGGAIDAHLKPQAFARRIEERAAGPQGGSDMVNRLMGCAGRTAPTSDERLLATVLTLGSALVVAAIMLIGHNELSRTIGLTMVPGVLAVGTQSALSRGHSWPARVALIGGPFVVMFLIGLAAGMIATR